MEFMCNSAKLAMFYADILDFRQYIYCCWIGLGILHSALAEKTQRIVEVGEVRKQEDGSYK